MRLIDADALMEAISKIRDQGYKHHLNKQHVYDLITNAPTVQREGRKLVPIDITEDMHIAAVKTIQKCTGNDDFPSRVYKAMLAAAPTDKE